MSTKIKLPLFPLNQVILPKEKIPLHIFEERYKKMIENCLNTNSEFGLIYMKNDLIENIGCSVSIEKVIKKYDDGKYDILCRGIKRFKINKIFKNKDSWFGNVIFLDEKFKDIEKGYFDNTLNKYLSFILSANIDTNFKAELNKKTSYDFMKNILLPLELKQTILNLDNEKKRLDFINDFLDLAYLSTKQSPSSKKNTLN